MPNLKQEFKLRIPDIVNQFSTPLIIYFADELNNRKNLLQSALPSGSQLLYSVKANPNPFILNLFNKAGLGFEVASAGELQQVIKSNVSSDRIVLGGPVKSREAITAGMNYNILSYNVESERDLLNITNASNQALNLSLRMNPDFSNRGSELKMGGVSSQFGVDENEVIPLIRKYRNLNINGLFMFAGSQFFDAHSIIQNTSYLIEFAERYKHEFGRLDFLDFGGGFGLPESSDQAELNIEILKAGLSDLFAGKKKFLDQVNYKFFESGRYLTATSAILISRVLDVKYSKGKKYIILDTGINHLGIKQLNYRIFKPFISTLKEYDQFSPAILTGATCTPIDIIQFETEFPDVELDDLVIIHNVGAYSATLSPFNFCGFTYPAELLSDENGNVSSIRDRGDVANSGGMGYRF
jgi:diaminopimelate decarboxylase